MGADRRLRVAYHFLSPSAWAAVEHPIDRDWSGYSALAIAVGDYASGNRMSVELVDARGAVWTAPLASGTWREAPVPFATFVPGAAGAGSLDLITLRALRVRLRPAPGGAGSGFIDIGGIRLAGGRGLLGPSVYVVAPLYAGEPWDPVARAVAAQGFTAVHLMPLDLTISHGDAIAAFHRAGLRVALAIHPTTDFHAYHARPDWRQRMLNGGSRFDWRVYLCPAHDGVRRHVAERVTALLASDPYDAVAFVEPWLEVWGGPGADNPQHGYYACIAEPMRQRFRRVHGADPLALFEARNGSYRLRPDVSGTRLYQQWVEFRAQVLAEFLAQVALAARRARPGIPVMVTHLADARIAGEEGRAREYLGQDLEVVLRTVRPEAVILETAWQDWLQSGLPPTYVRDYARAYRRLVNGRARTLVLPDVGSIVARPPAWVRDMAASVRQAGLDGYVLFSWDVSAANPRVRRSVDGFEQGVHSWQAMGEQMEGRIARTGDARVGSSAAHVVFGPKTPWAWAAVQTPLDWGPVWARQGYTTLAMWVRAGTIGYEVAVELLDSGGRAWRAPLPLETTAWQKISLPLAGFRGGGPVPVQHLAWLRFVADGPSRGPGAEFWVDQIQLEREP
ncbi:MAG: hypothetical protein HY660_16295 [Armatimonadetes bacterium]|nr:hypothetical protein [Armatimonadota bacterium]